MLPLMRLALAGETHASRTSHGKIRGFESFITIWDLDLRLTRVLDGRLRLGSRARCCSTASGFGFRDGPEGCEPRFPSPRPSPVGRGRTDARSSVARELADTLA